MVDSNNLEASVVVRVTAVILIAVSLLSSAFIFKSLRNLIYKESQLALVPIYVLPMVIGWISWIQLLNSEELRSVQFITILMKALCLTSFMAYIQYMIGLTREDGKTKFSEESLISNLVISHNPRFCCIKLKPINSTEKAISYLKKIRYCVYQLVAVFVICTAAGILYAIIARDPKLHNGKGPRLFTILSGITSASSIIALLSLLHFGIYTNSLSCTSHLKILHKFIIIKLGLLFTEIQPLIITIFSSTGLIANTDTFPEVEITLYTNSLLLISEMIAMALLIIEVFPLSDYKIRPTYIDSNDSDIK